MFLGRILGNLPRKEGVGGSIFSEVATLTKLKFAGGECHDGFRGPGDWLSLGRVSQRRQMEGIG